MTEKRGPGNFKSRAVAEAKKQGLDPVEDFDTPVRQQPLIPGTDKPAIPSAVRGRMMMCTYVKPHYALTKDDRLVGLEISFPLTDEHRDLLPKSVCDEWNHLKRSSSKRIVNIDVPAQTVEIRFAPDDDVELSLSGAMIARATLSVIQEKGTGAAKKVIRFSFQIISDVMKNVCTFADNQFGKVVWIQMANTQGEL